MKEQKNAVKLSMILDDLEGFIVNTGRYAALGSQAFNQKMAYWTRVGFDHSSL